MTTWTKLSETAVGKIKPPAKGRDYYRDNRTPGLSLCVYATGAKVFEYVGDADGRTMRLTLGRHPSTSVGQARVEAVKLAGDVARGVNRPSATHGRICWRATSSPAAAPRRFTNTRCCGRNIYPHGQPGNCLPSSGVTS